MLVGRQKLQRKENVCSHFNIGSTNDDILELIVFPSISRVFHHSKSGVIL
jgi:hypothetical protein